MKTPLAIAALFICAGAYAGDQSSLSSLKQEAGKQSIGVPVAQATAAEDKKAELLSKFFPKLPATPASSAPSVSSNKGMPAAPVADIDLKSILNVYSMTDTTFTSASGKVVHVSMNKVSNCPDGASSCDMSKKFAVVLRPGNGPVIGANAYEVANYGIFVSGKRNISIDGTAYTVRLNIASLDETKFLESSIEIKQGKQVVFNQKLSAVVNSMRKHAKILNMNKQYMFFVANDLVHGQNNNITAKGTASYIFIPNNDQEFQDYVAIPNTSITKAGVSFPNWVKGYNFRVTDDGHLIIYR